MPRPSPACPALPRVAGGCRIWRPRSPRACSAQATDAADLKALLLKLLGSAAERARLGRAAAELVARQAGATRRMAERVLVARQMG